MKKILGKISSLIYVLVILGLIGLAFLNFNPQINFFNKLKIRALVVKSGSMAPTIKVGSLVFARQMETYQSGDIITFKNPLAQKELITHRLFRFKDENGQEVMVTKGDANKTVDQTKLTPSHIVGKVFFTLPYWGYLVHYSRQPVGIILLIVFPALLIILIELLKIREEILKFKQKKRADKLEESLTMIAVIFACLVSFSSFLISDTQAKFFDQEKAEVCLQAGTWCEPVLNCDFDSQTNSFSFQISNLCNEFEKLSYKLSYWSGNTRHAVSGDVQETLKDSFAREFLLGTCSDEGCFWHDNIKNLRLKVTLEDGRKTKLKCEFF